MKNLLKLTLLFLLLSGVLTVQAQKVIKPKPKASPIGLTSFLMEDTYLKATFGQPFKNGREIFGTLVPYGKIWRTGANEATEFTTTKDIKIDKKLLKAGTYTIFTVPNADKWTVIFNSSLGQWGAYKYDEIKSANVLEIEANVEKSDDEYEAFTIIFEQNKKGVDMLLLWDKTKVVVPISAVGKNGK